MPIDTVNKINNNQHNKTSENKMKRKKITRKKSNKTFKKGMNTNVKNIQHPPTRGGYRL
jgi:hypothetical protein